MRTALAIALVAACAKSAPPPPPVAMGSGSAAVAPRVDAAVPPVVPSDASPIPVGSHQLITTVVADWTSTTGVLRVWHRDDGAWIADGAAWPVVVGKRGVAWGRGLHGDALPVTARDTPLKTEGDGKAPAGAFALRGAYGYADEAPPDTRLAYVPLTADSECVDDAASQHYTQIVERGSVDHDWDSSEHMRRKDALYTWVIDIAHNPDASRGLGSCIFFHVWRDAASPTVGCTAMDEPHMRTLLHTLAPAASPVYVLLPRAEYAAVQTAWGLPPLEASANVSP